MTDPRLADALRGAVADPVRFSRLTLPTHKLRAYQEAPARAVAASVVAGAGRHFAWVFSRQSGKDETLAQLLAWLLVRYQRRGGAAVVGCPTLNPQAALARDRLKARLDAGALTKGRARVRDGYIVELGKASARFLSADESANPRGQTADLLLVANEAQDIDPGIWQARFDPMAASTNATTLYMGTVWDQHGLLWAQMKHLEALQAADGEQRLYTVPWRSVAAVLPPYGQRVRALIAQHGERHPYIRTEYELEALDGEGGLFPAQRRAQLAGAHPRRHAAEAGGRYALLVDVAGEEEAEQGPDAYESGAKRDATAVTVVQIIDGAAGALPGYRVVDRMAWTGRKHATLLPQLEDLARSVWQAAVVVIDATGVGAGLANLLADRLGGGPRRIPVERFAFTAASKSALGWEYVGLIDTGRVKEYADDGAELTRDFWRQMERCAYETLPGPGRLLRWGVPDRLGHDDLLISAALVARLDALDLAHRVARGR